jgi:hypothetical protein
MRDTVILAVILIFWITYGIFVNVFFADPVIAEQLNTNQSQAQFINLNTTIPLIPFDLNISVNNYNSTTNTGSPISISIISIPIVGWIYALIVFLLNIVIFGISLLTVLINILSFIILGIPNLPIYINMWIAGLNYILSIITGVTIYKIIKGSSG